MSASDDTKTLAIVYHSQSGRNERLARAVADGAAREPVTVVCRRAFDADITTLMDAGAVIFGTPENIGYLSGGLKDFLDRTFYPAERLGLTLVYAQFVCTGNDGSNALRQMDRILSGYPMRKVAEPLVVYGPPDDNALDRAAELGQTVAAGLAMGIF